MLVLFALLVWISAVIRFVFPPGPNAAGWLLWGWTYSQWSDLQFALLCLVAFAVLVHLMLHWSWVCGVIASHFLSRRDGKKRAIDDGTRTIWGVAVLILLLNVLGLGLAAAVLTVQSPS